MDHGLIRQQGEVTAPAVDANGTRVLPGWISVKFIVGKASLVTVRHSELSMARGVLVPAFIMQI
jgi:hypothetical protein